MAREIGHATTDMIEDRYGHVFRRGVNPELVEFRVEHFADELAVHRLPNDGEAGLQVA